MRKAELRVNDARDPRVASRPEQSPAATSRMVVQDGGDTTGRRAKRLGLLLMAASSLVMIGLFGVIWLIARQLF